MKRILLAIFLVVSFSFANNFDQLTKDFVNNVCKILNAEAKVKVKNLEDVIALKFLGDNVMIEKIKDLAYALSDYLIKVFESTNDPDVFIKLYKVYDFAYTVYKSKNIENFGRKWKYTAYAAFKIIEKGSIEVAKLVKNDYELDKKNFDNFVIKLVNTKYGIMPILLLADMSYKLHKIVKKVIAVKEYNIRKILRSYIEYLSYYNLFLLKNNGNNYLPRAAKKMYFYFTYNDWLRTDNMAKDLFNVAYKTLHNKYLFKEKIFDIIFNSILVNCFILRIYLDFAIEGRVNTVLQNISFVKFAIDYIKGDNNEYFLKIKKVIIEKLLTKAIKLSKTFIKSYQSF